MSEQVRLLTPEECASAGKVLERAFYDDPLQLWFLPDAEDRGMKASPVFSSLAMHSVLYGEVLTPASGVTPRRSGGSRDTGR